MIRLNIICEGQTEESFVNHILVPYFALQNIFITASLIGTSRHKGGNVKWERLVGDLERILKKDSEVYCTTFLDFYGLDSDFPQKKVAEREKALSKKHTLMNEALLDAVTSELGSGIATRFIPYIQMYEFEALLFSDPLIMEKKLKVQGFTNIRNVFDTPEHINNGSATAPSKRIEKLYPSYQKVINGTLIAEAITLDKIRCECTLFNAWLQKIQELTH